MVRSAWAVIYVLNRIHICFCFFLHLIALNIYFSLLKNIQSYLHSVLVVTPVSLEVNWSCDAVRHVRQSARWKTCFHGAFVIFKWTRLKTTSWHSPYLRGLAVVAFKKKGFLHEVFIGMFRFWTILVLMETQRFLHWLYLIVKDWSGGKSFITAKKKKTCNQVLLFCFNWHLPSTAKTQHGLHSSITPSVLQLVIK